MKIEQSVGAERVRVSHVVFSLEPGGLENGVVNVANGLERRKFETEIVCLVTRGSFCDRLKSDVEVCSLDKPPGVSLRTLFRLASHFRTSQPNIVHTHNLGPLFYTVLARFLARGRFRILHGEHGVFRAADLRRKRLLMRRTLYRACHVVHTVSASLTAYLVEELRLPARRFATVINGVDCERFHPPDDKAAAKKKLKFSPDSTILGMVGRMIPSKRHLLMFEAFEHLAAEDTSLELLVVGDGGESRDAIVEAAERHRFRERVHLVGHQADPVPYYQVFDLLVMPSSVEGLSNALLEAMACGVPCLAHPACGATEVISDSENGFLRVMDNPDEVVKAILHSTSSREELRRLGEASRCTARSDFSLDTMVGNYAALYLDMLP